MIQVGFLFLLYIAAATAATPAPANPPCVSTFKPVTNFDPTKFASTWYEVRQISPGSEGTCELATFKAQPDKTLSVTRVWVDTAGKTQVLTGTVKTSGAKPTDAQLTVTFGTSSVQYILFYLNYSTVFAAYSCNNNKAYVSVFAKTQAVQDGALKDINQAMTNSGLDPKLLKLTPRKGCPANA